MTLADPIDTVLMTHVVLSRVQSEDLIGNRIGTGVKMGAVIRALDLKIQNIE